MIFEEPTAKGFTIYSKSGCANCINVKKLLKENNFDVHIISCDEYIVENKKEFLLFIKNIINFDYKFFPMVFHDNKFIGGLNETTKYIKRININLNTDNF